MMANWHEEGYEDHRFEHEVDRSLHCPICLNVLKDPMQCRQNQHLFCSPCIKRYLEQHSQTCPTCREALTVETLVRPARIVIDFLSPLKIRCNFVDRGCRELVELEFLKRHVAQCGYSPTVCDGCSMVINKVDKEHHENNDCGVRKVKCKECGEELLYKKFKIHGCALKKEIDEVKTNLNEMKTEVKDQFGMIRRQMQRSQEEMIEEVRQMKIEMNEAKEELKYVKKIIEGPPHSHINTKEDIVVAGGHDGRSQLNSVESFSWSKATWEPLQSMKQRRTGASSFVYQQQMFVAGGSSSGSGFRSLDNLERLNIDKKPAEWSNSVAKLPVKLYAHTSVVYQNRLIVTGGYTGNERASDDIFEILLTPPYTSKLLCKMPQPRIYHCSHLFGDNILTFGGSKTSVDKESTNSVLLYDITTNKLYEQKARLPFAVSGMASVRWNNSVILMGGVDENGNALNTVVKYDVKTGKSELLPPMEYKRRGCAAVVTENVVVVMGGWNKEQRQLNSVECFRFDRNVWEKLPPMIGKRLYPSAVVKTLV